MRLAPVLIALAALPVQAQHCGTRGIHEPDALPGERVVAIDHDAAKDWAWWKETVLAWTDPGAKVPRSVRVPVGGGRFFEGWVFVAPAGDAFLITGCPMLEREAPFPALFYFFDAQGKPLAEVRLDQAFAEAERKTVGSCGAGAADGSTGCYRYFALGGPPKRSADGASVELEAPGTRRVVRFFLPLGLVVGDALTAQLRAALERGPIAARLASLLAAEKDDAAKARLKALSAALDRSGPAEEREKRFLDALRAYPDEAVARRAKARCEGAE